jgi:DNA mismatch repair protein MutL
MGRIAVLPTMVQGQIAAGEVIERPASVVRELVENAIDAGARHVDVVLEDGGVAGITVRDDGCGMAPEDAELAFARHATSKLQAAEDLERVPTFGFRGEALPSIAAAGRVVLRTRTADDASGVTVEADGGGVRRGPAAGMPPGTVVEVRDLFATTPARLKFLRRPATELGHAVDVVARLAVAHPEVGLRVMHDRRFALDLPPVGDLRTRIGQVLGRARTEALAEMQGEVGGLRVHGFVGPPRDSLGSPRLVWTYVSLGTGARVGAPRWIRDRVVLSAVMAGYDTFLMRGRYPICVLVLRLPPGTVDVNVHPAKLEVRFRDTRPVHRVVSDAVRRAVVAQQSTAAVAPAGPADVAPIAAAPVPDAGPVEGAEAAPPVPAAAAGPAVREEPAPEYERAPVAETASLRQPGLWRAAPEGFARLRFVAQVFDGYLVCDAGDRLVVVDQHAAHERIIFERLRARVAERPVERDALLVPETIHVSRTELAALAEHAELLEQSGIEGEPFGDETYLLRSVPRSLHGRDVAEVVRAVAADLASDGVTRAADAARERVLATIACHAATRVGQRLAPTEAAALLEQMDAAAVNAHCPHGRPVAIQLPRSQLEALFGR